MDKWYVQKYFTEKETQMSVSTQLKKMLKLTHNERNTH